MGQATIFAGQKIKTLKSTLSLNGGADIISSTTNPQTSAVSAEPGSLLLNTTSGIMYRKLDAGLTTNWVEVGAGSGGKNYISNPDFDGGSTSGWSMQKVSLSSLIPTGNIGAPDAGHTIAASSSSPLEGANSLLVQGASAFTAGNCLVSKEFAIDREDQAKVMGWSFYYEAVTANMDFPGTSAGTWAVYIAEVTTATPNTVVSWIQPAGVYNLVQGSGAGIASGTFQTTATGTAYRLVLVCINSEAAATTLKVDDFQLGPQKVLQGPSGPVGEIIATGSLTPPVGFLYCNGSAVSRTQYSDLFREIGTTYGVGDGSTTFNLPDLRGVFARGAGSQTIGAETYSATLGTKQNDATSRNGLTISDPGHVHAAGTDNAQFVGTGTGTSANIGPGGGYVIKPFTTTASTGVSLGAGDAETRPANVAVAYHIRYLATYQMSQDTDTRVVAFHAAGTSTQGIAAGPTVLITGWSPTVDTHAQWSSGSQRYVIPVSGNYRVKFSALFNSTAVSASGAIQLLIRVDGVTTINEIIPGGPLAASLRGGTGSGIINLRAGQYIDFAIYQDTGTTLILAGVGFNVSIERLSGPATIAASESVQINYYTAGGAGIPLSGTALIYGTRNFDSHSAYNGSTGIFTAPISGKYLVSAQYSTSSSSIGSFYIQVLKQGSLYGEAVVNRLASVSSVFTNSITALVDLNAGQTCQVNYYSTVSSQNLTASAAQNNIQIVRVGN